jgi:hypothetical protein
MGKLLCIENQGIAKEYIPSRTIKVYPKINHGSIRALNKPLKQGTLCTEDLSKQDR